MSSSSFISTSRAKKVDGKSHAMVAPGAQGRRRQAAVVAVLLDNKGGANPTIEAIWKNLPKEKEKEVVVRNVTVDAAKLLPADKGYYTFRVRSPRRLAARACGGSF
jgi:carbonic anhydrase